MQNENPTERPGAGNVINPTPPQVPTDSGMPGVPPQMPQPEKKPSKFGKLRLSRKKLIVILAVILVLGGAAAAYFITKPGKTEKSSDQTSQQNAEELRPEENTEEEPSLQVKDTIKDNSYLATYKQLSDLKFFKDPAKDFGGCEAKDTKCIADYGPASIKYYQIGNTKNGKRIILVVAPPQGPGGEVTYTAIEDSSGKYTVLTLMGGYLPTQSDVDNSKAQYSSNITLNTTSVLEESVFGNEVSVKNQPFISIYDEEFQPTGAFKGKAFGHVLIGGLTGIRGSFSGDTKTSAMTKIATIGDKDIYRVVAVDQASYQAVEIYGVYKNVFAVQYFDYDEIGKNGNDGSQTLNISWTKGEQTKSNYGGSFTLKGCGVNGFIVVKNVTTGQLTQVGQTPQGAKVYQLPTSHPLVQKIYKDDYGKGEFLENKSLKNLTVQQFTDKHGYILAKNNLSDWVLYVRSDMVAGGGCAKPVIYLYPTQDTKVSVKVGADVVKSDPLYPDNGWQNVFARANGSLSYNGKSYDSLFWEGYGIGLYPEINIGTVVAHKDAVQTIRNQLAAQGLNTKEMNDFVEFWQPKLPSTPYVRLTWLGTRAMNQLAPLKISPAPQTVIRVFLDFEGLQAPINLPKQSFAKPERKGFTVVEWGGLLAGGLY